MNWKHLDTETNRFRRRFSRRCQRSEKDLVLALMQMVVQRVFIVSGK